MPGPGDARPREDGDSSSDEVTLLQLQASALLPLDALTDVSDSSDTVVAENEAVVAKATARTTDTATARKLVAQKRRQARKPSVADGRGKRIRGLLTSLGTLMKIGNSRLCVMDNLFAAVMAKPGGLSKQGIMRWSRGLGTGPSFAGSPRCSLRWARSTSTRSLPTTASAKDFP